MGTKNTSNALQWNANGFLYATKSGGTLVSVTVNGTSGKSVKIFAQNTAYSANASGAALTTLSLTGSAVSYEFQDDYSYLCIDGTASSTAITSIEIVWETEAGGSDSPSLTTSDLTLTASPIALTFDLYNNSEAQVITYTTSSTGAVTVSESEYIETEVGNGTITVTPIKKTSGDVEITVNQAADDTYAAGSATFTINITDSTPKTGSWVVTDIADLTADDVFVIVGNNGNTYAMSNDNGTGSAPGASAVTVEDDAITSTVADNVKWKISGNATDGYTFYPNGSTESSLYCTNNNNGLRVGSGNDNTFIITNDYLYNSGQKRYVGIYNNTDWRSYTTINNNIKDQTFAFYKYVDNAAVKKPVITVDETFEESTTATITCTTDGAIIMYSYDNENWLNYSEALTITATTTIYAKATTQAGESEVVSKTTTKVLPTPTITIGTFNNEELKVDLDGATNVPAGTLTATITYNGTPIEGATVTWSSSNDNIAIIEEDGNVHLQTIGEVTFTATFAGNNDYAAATATKTITVIDSNVPGASAENPYTVAQALAANASTGVYVTGIVSRIVSSSVTSNGQIRYYISDDGTSSGEMNIYNGKGLNDADFTSIDDIQVGDKVVIRGDISEHQGNNQMNANNYLISLYRKPAATITVQGGTEQTIDRTQDEEELTLSATANSGATVVFTIDEENTTVSADNYEFEDGLLLVSGTKGGVIVIKANAEAAGEYNAAEEVTITVTVVGVKKDATILVEDASLACGATYTVSEEDIEGGAITVTSDNEYVATVSGLTITANAVGTATITVATAENAEYKAGSATFTLTVTAPSPKDDAATSGFVKVTSSSDITSGQYLIVYEDGENSVAFDGGLETLDVNGNTIDVGINNNTIAVSNATTAAAFTIDPTAGTIQNANGKYIGVSSNNNGLKQSDDENTYFNTISYDGSNSVISAAFDGSSMSLQYYQAGDQKRFRYYKSSQKAIQLYKLSGGPSVTLNANGYATYCSEYPLYFTADDEVSAWKVTEVEGENITFVQVTGTVPGGTGLLLKGEANTTVSLTSERGTHDADLTGNLLEGKMAPTYVESGQYYGLYNNTFRKLGTGVVSGNKAILPQPISPSGVKAFTFVFKSDVATSIEKIENGMLKIENAAIFNLSGQRISKPQKGINIVNGKKVLVK